MDPVLRRTRAAAAEMLRQISLLPPGQQIAELDRALASYDPKLPATVRRVADHLRHQKRMSVRAAMHEGLARALADSAIAKIKEVGVRARALQGAERGDDAADAYPYDGLSGPREIDNVPFRRDVNAYPYDGLSGLGNAGSVAADMTRGLVCSAEVQAAITDLVGRNEGATGASLTALGFAISQLAARCSPSSAAPPPAPPPPPPEKASLMVPLAIAGAAVLVVGAIAFAARAK